MTRTSNQTQRNLQYAELRWKLREHSWLSSTCNSLSVSAAIDASCVPKGWAVSTLNPSTFLCSLLHLSLSFQATSCCSCAFPSLSQRTQLFADLITSCAPQLVPERIYLPTSLVQVSSKESLSERVRRIITPCLAVPNILVKAKLNLSIPAAINGER